MNFAGTPLITLVARYVKFNMLYPVANNVFCFSKSVLNDVVALVLARFALSYFFFDKQTILLVIFVQKKERIYT